MVQKKDTIDEYLKDIVRDIEKLKEVQVKEDFAVFDGFKMAEQLELRLNADLGANPTEVAHGCIAGTSRVGFFEV